MNKLSFLVIAALALGGCDKASETVSGKPQASASKSCLPISTNSMVAYDEAQLAKADFCVPAGETTVELIMADSENWASSWKPGNNPRIAFAISGPDPQLTPVTVRTDKNAYRFALQPSKTK